MDVSKPPSCLKDINFLPLGKLTISSFTRVPLTSYVKDSSLAKTLNCNKIKSHNKN